MRAVILLGIGFVLLALALATATARTGGASSRSTFVVGCPRDPRRPVGLDAARADRGASALRRRSLAARRRVAARTLADGPCSSSRSSSSGRTSTARSSSARGSRCFSDRRAGAHTPARVDPARARRPLARWPCSRRPYGTKLVAYYDLMLVDAPFAPDPARVAVVEPERDDRALLAPRARRRRAARACDAAGSRLTFYELAVLARDVRRRGAGGPRRDLVRARGRRDPPGRPRRRSSPRRTSRRRGVNRIISLAALAGLAVATLAFLARPASWFVSEWPEPRSQAVRDGDARPERHALGDGRHRRLAPLADPRPPRPHRLRRPLRALRPADARRDSSRYGHREGGLDGVVDGYDVVVVDDAGHLDALRASQARASSTATDDIASSPGARHECVHTRSLARTRSRESQPGPAVRPDRGRSTRGTMS